MEAEIEAAAVVNIPARSFVVFIDGKPEAKTEAGEIFVWETVTD